MGRPEGLKSVLIAKGREGIIRYISCFLAERKDCLLCRHVNTVQTGKGGVRAITCPISCSLKVKAKHEDNGRTVEVQLKAN